MTPTHKKYLFSQQMHTRYRKQCVRPKNVLFQNDIFQIGVKIDPLYDLYTSQYHLDVSLFIGNKTDTQIQTPQLHYRGSDNLQAHKQYQQINRDTIPPKTQHRHRLILSCSNPQDQTLLLVYNLHSIHLTIRDAVLPISLWSFCVFTSPEPIKGSLHQTLAKKYEYTEERTIQINNKWRKDTQGELKKWFKDIRKWQQNTYYGVFHLNTLIMEYAIVFGVEEKQIKVLLYCGDYYCFDRLLDTLTYLLE